MISINKNFISPEEIEIILNYAKYDAPKEWGPNIPLFWRNRSLAIMDIEDPSPKDKLVLELLINTRNRVKQHITEIQGLTVPIYGDSVQLVRWPEGYEQAPHADAEYNTSEEGEYVFPHRYCGSLIYLNDDFDGGEIYFPQHDLELKPVPGMMLTFPGTREYLHGVRPVTNGIRYVISSFYTLDESKADVLPN
jgi:predicted 2-oxoglutarate/Fe(II)-dependent dioxygenase YbiX